MFEVGTLPHLTHACPSSQKTGLQFGTANSYLNLEKIGEGTYATVYKGISRSVSINQSVVIKCLCCNPTLTPKSKRNLKSVQVL